MVWSRFEIHCPLSVRHVACLKPFPMVYDMAIYLPLSLRRGLVSWGLYNPMNFARKWRDVGAFEVASWPNWKYDVWPSSCIMATSPSYHLRNGHSVAIISHSIKYWCPYLFVSAASLFWRVVRTKVYPMYWFTIKCRRHLGQLKVYWPMDI